MSESKLPGVDRDLLPEGDDLEAAYSPEYLQDCADHEAREERIAELRRRIALEAYRVDSDWIARAMLDRGLLSES